MAAQILDSNLQSTGVRAVVTSRAKNPNRLETKIRQHNDKKVYERIENIFFTRRLPDIL